MGGIRPPDMPDPPHHSDGAPKAVRRSRHGSRDPKSHKIHGDEAGYHTREDRRPESAQSSERGAAPGGPEFLAPDAAWTHTPVLY
jgi:hypothetical protein